MGPKEQMKHWIMALALVAPACSPAPAQQETDASRASTPQPATPAAQFVARAAMFEAFQIQAAQIAQANAQSQAAKDYAAAALAEHHATLQHLSAAARAAGMPAPSTTLDDDYNAYLDRLRHAAPQSFDATYAAQQAIVSMSASGLYDSFTSTAPETPLRRWAEAQSAHVHDGIGAARALAGAARQH